MVVDAFIYVYLVGMAAALGVASVAWMAWKVVQRSKKKANSKKKGAF